MGNHRTRSINYTPRMTDAAAYEKLWPEVREALQGGVMSWSSYALYRYQQKHNLAETLALLAYWNSHEAKRPLIAAKGVKGSKGYVPPVPSTVISCRVKPLVTKWRYR